MLRRAARRGSARRYERAYRRSSAVCGRVVGATGRGLFVELPEGLPAFVRRRELPRAWRRHPSLAVGEPVEGIVVELPPDGVILLSPRELALRRCRAVVDKRRPVTARVCYSTRAGLVVEVFGLQGFLPRSEPLASESSQPDVGATVSAYVIGMSGNQPILSVASETPSASAIRRMFGNLGSR